MAEAVLVVLADRVVVAQQLVAAQQQLGEVDHALALALLVVGRVELDEAAVEIVVGLDVGRAQALLLGVVDEVLSSWAGTSRRRRSALSSRLIASWSWLSRIWKVCGRPASRKCARSMRLHRPWKVPIHMPRVLIGSIDDSRVCISLAALLVKVTARMPAGDTRPFWISQAIRVVSTRVLPLPAPARIRAGSSGRVTAASCSALRLASRLDIGAGPEGRPQLYRRPPPRPGSNDSIHSPGPPSGAEMRTGTPPPL
jgi:hypothetical protein